MTTIAIDCARLVFLTTSTRALTRLPAYWWIRSQSAKRPCGSYQKRYIMLCIRYLLIALRLTVPRHLLVCHEFKLNIAESFSRCTARKAQPFGREVRHATQLLKPYGKPSEPERSPSRRPKTCALRRRLPIT